MNRTASCFALLAITFISACTDGTSFPEATGRASITAINAIFGSPTVSVLIEERPIGSIGYRTSTASESYDDLDYTFNFEVLFIGDNNFTRVASQHVDFVADQQYTLVATGSINAPTITVWETSERDFVAADTVFRSRFAHTSASLGAIDIYFALDGTAPVLGEEVATLNFGEISDPSDFETNAYVVTVTTAGDPTDVLFQSSAATIPSQIDLIISPFDGDANDTSPVVVLGLSPNGGGILFQDPGFPSTLQFLNAARDLGNSDVYDDEMLTSQILANHDHQGLSAEVPITAGTKEFFYTPAGNTGMVSLETTFTAADGIKYRIIATGSGGTYEALALIPDRRSVLTAGRLNFFNSSSNFDATDLYVVEAGATIENQVPFRQGIVSRFLGPAQQMLPGSYDLYLTNFQVTDTTIAGPFRLDIAANEVADLVAFDTADPAILEIVALPVP